MAIYSIIAHKGSDALGTKIQTVYPDNYALPPSTWFIADTISAEQVCAKLNLLGGEGSTQAVVLRVLGGAGFAAADVWEWFKAKREKHSQKFANEITTQGPHPLGPANQEEAIMAQHENAPPHTQEPGRDLSEPPAHDPPANQVAYARSRIRPLIIFIAGVVATLVWQSWGGAALDAINGATKDAICPRAAPVAQDNYDMNSAASPSHWRHGFGWRPPSVH
jgi:hypothetical protein